MDIAAWTMLLIQSNNDPNFGAAIMS